LALGDIAINTYDGKAYIKKAIGNNQTILELGTGGSSVSASFASTASYAFFAVTASFAQNFNPAATASYALFAISSSYASSSLSASYALSSSHSNTTGFAISSSYALSSSYSLFAESSTSSSYALSSSYSSNAGSSISSSYAISASYAATASSVGILNQNVVINGNLNVTGTASFTYVTSSIVQVGASVITLNTDFPAVRFGGITVIDSGSFGNSSTGSIFWDSLNNKWIYSNPSGSNYDGGMFISGPRNTSGLGNEQGTTLNAILKGQGGDHLTSSGMFEDSAGNIGVGLTGSSLAKLQVAGNVYATSFTGSFFGTASNAESSSYAVTASYAVSSSFASTAATASYVLNAVSASYSTNALSASYADTAVSASYAISSSVVFISNQSTTNVDYPLIFKGDSAALDSYRTLAADTGGPYYNPLRNTLGSVSGLIISASSFSGPLTGSLLGTASYADNAKVFPFTGSAIISGSLTVEGNVSVTSATSVDFNTSVLNINAPLLQVPSFGLPYSPSANVRVVMYDAVSNALFVTASAPSSPIITNFIATGSISASVQIGPGAAVPYFFLVQSGSVEMLKINAERVVVLEARIDIPTPVTGGLYYSASGDFFFGM
jgi:hypothetical protein